jgi:AcrR family transcriptional regulator
VFSVIGFDRASMEQIANEAGVTRTAIKNYFTTKIELHRAAFQTVYEGAAVLHARVPGPEAPVVERLVAFYAEAIAANDEDMSFAKFWVTARIDGVHHRELQEQSEQQLRQTRRFLQTIIEDGKKQGQVAHNADSAQVADIFLDLLSGLAFDAGFRAQPIDVDRTLSAIRALLEGSVLRTSYDGHVASADPELRG